jgi:hypothetical protein
MTASRPTSTLLLHAVVALVLATLAPLALACPVCSTGAPLSVAQRMIDAERAVLARPEPDRVGAWRIVATLKGDPATLAPIDAPDAPMPFGARPDERPVLLVRDRISKVWTAVGAVDASRADWLRSLGALQRTRDMGADDWRRRVELFLPLLEDAEPLVAETAYGEVARAPYAAMRANRAKLDAARLGRWVDDPALQARRPLYLLLLGLAGGPADAARIERQLAAVKPGEPRADVPALLAANLELRGPARMAWVEKQWLLDPGRPPTDLQAALIALSVHGEDAGTIPRERVAAAYLRFIEQRRAYAGLVAQDLAAWGVWDATPAYVRLVDAPDLPFVSRIAIMQYLRESPRPEAKEAVDRAMRPR